MQKTVNLLVKQLDEAQNNANPHEYTALTHGRLLCAHHSLPLLSTWGYPCFAYIQYI